MAKDVIRMGIVGCGASVHMYGPALRHLDGAQVVAWMDPQYDKAVAAASRYGGQAFSDYDEFLRRGKFDAVVIASPPWQHLPQAKQAAEAGKHVLCEKPLARTTAECRAIIDAMVEADRILMVGFMKRFSPYFSSVKEMIDSGELGEVLEIAIDWSWPQYFLAGWRDQRQCLGGLFLDHGSHTVDLCRWWVGDIASVSAVVRILFAGREVEDYAQVIFRHRSGCISTHHNSRMTHKPLRECYTIEGRKATVTLECLDKWSYNSLEPFVMKKYTLGKVETITPALAPNVEDQLRDTWMYLGSMRYFVECIRQSRQPAFCSGLDGLAAIEAINAAYLSSFENRIVALPLAAEYDLEHVFQGLLDRKEAR